MIKSISQYIREEVWPRRKDILLGSELWMAFIISLLLYLLGGRVLHVEIKTDTIVGAILTYASIALGFCVTGLTIALMIQEKDIAVKLIKTVIVKDRNALSDLLFVFSWTATCHCLLIALSIWILLLYGDCTVFTVGMCISYRVIFSMYAFVCVYSIMQFFITIITLSQVGNVYIKLIKEDGK